MCEFCEMYDRHIKVAREAAARVPELREGLFELVKFLRTEKDGSAEGPGDPSPPRQHVGHVMGAPPDMRFKCPECGGSSFGSSMDSTDPSGPMHRYCHGNDAGDGKPGCKFNWPDQQDWKYFSVAGQMLTQDAYDTLMAEVRKIGVAGHPYQQPGNA